jgi:Methyltransferase domain
MEMVGRAVPERLRGRWHLSLGDARELLPSLPAPQPWDVFFHDSEHSRAHMLWEYGVAWSHLRPGGLLISDDVPNNDAFLTFSRSVGRSPFLWLRRGAIRKQPAGTPVA